MFGGSQSASASMSANMNRIVEGVERLVESDTYENAPDVPGQFEPFMPDTGDMPTPSGHVRPSPHAFPFNEQGVQSLGTPIAPSWARSTYSHCSRDSSRVYGSAIHAIGCSAQHSQHLEHFVSRFPERCCVPSDSTRSWPTSPVAFNGFG